MSAIPIDLSKARKGDTDREILRIGMIAELDAINLYEQLAAKAQDPRIKAVLFDIAREEKTHTAEFQTLLLMLDKEQVKENEEGRREVLEKTGKEK